MRRNGGGRPGGTAGERVRAMATGFFGGRQAAPDAARFPAMAQLRAYWMALCDAPGLPPLRSRIDPRGIAEVLEQTFLIERVAPGVARFRLAGMRLGDLMGMDARGMVLSTLFDPASRPDLATTLDAVFTAPATAELALEAERGLGRPALEGRMLLLPLRGDDGRTTMALGCLATDGSVGRAPRRFATARRTVTPMTAAPKAGAATAGAATAGAATAGEPKRAAAAEHGFAEAPRLFAAPPRPAPGRPHLRLVKS